jgi:hypothetical protein
MMRMPVGDQWGIFGELKIIIPTAPIQVDGQFCLADEVCDLVPLFKAERSQELLDRYRMRFGMGPILWAEADLFRTAFPMILMEISSMGVLSHNDITIWNNNSDT